MRRGGTSKNNSRWSFLRLLLINVLPLAGLGGLLGSSAPVDPSCFIKITLFSCIAVILEIFFCGKAGLPRFVCFLSGLYMVQFYVLQEGSHPAPKQSAPSSNEALPPQRAANVNLRPLHAFQHQSSAFGDGSNQEATVASVPEHGSSQQAIAASMPNQDEVVQTVGLRLEDPGAFPPTPVSPPSVIKTVSVVLPCAEERELALKTVSKFCERTPAHVLIEVIVVDDGSNPPLKELFQAKFNKPDCNVIFLRHEETTGLMAAKQTGGKAAKGDVVAFFDCHVSPKESWSDEIVKLTRENPKRMVVPLITDLDLDTFEERKNSASHAKCYLTWDADFKWFDDKSDYIPTISGGLVAMTRWWFNATGGFDEVMRGWGGENLDQSLRSWLCGGEIMRAKSSRIAHMWRTGDRRTAPHYHGARHGRVDNRGRVVAAWYDVFAQKYPGRKTPESEVHNFDAVKKSLGCKPFAYFLYRFRHVYIDGGVIADKAFHFKDKQTGLCLNFGHYKLTASKCDINKREQQIQLANQDQDEGGGKCCSGIKMFGSNNCLDYVKDGVPMPYSCDITGSNRNQQYRWRASGKIEKAMDGTCMGKPKGTSNKVTLGSCDNEHAGLYEQWGARVPVEHDLYISEVKRLGYDKLTSLPSN